MTQKNGDGTHKIVQDKQKILKGKNGRKNNKHR
jgi:hypothetical protein